MSNAKLNKKFLQVAPKATIDSVLNSIAKHYGTTVADIKDELTHEDAESILDYIPESGMRRAVSVLMQKYGIRASYLGNNMNAKTRLQKTRLQATVVKAALDADDLVDATHQLCSPVQDLVESIGKSVMRELGVQVLPKNIYSNEDLLRALANLYAVQYFGSAFDGVVVGSVTKKPGSITVDMLDPEDARDMAQSLSEECESSKDIKITAKGSLITLTTKLK